MEKFFSYWWLPLILGIIIMALGIAIMLFPGASYVTLSLLFGVIIILSGIFNIVMASSKTAIGRGWMIAMGVVEILLGLFLTLFPALSAVTIPFFFGFWLLLKGFMLIGVGFDLSKIKGSGWFWSIITAVMVIICAIIVLAQPLVFGVEAVLLWIEISLIICGLTLMSFAFQLKQGTKEN